MSLRPTAPRTGRGGDRPLAVERPQSGDRQREERDKRADIPETMDQEDEAEE